MRICVAICMVLLCWGSLPASPGKTEGSGTRYDFALADADTQESLSFTLAGKSTSILPVIITAIDHHHLLDGAAQASKVPQITDFVIEKDAAAPISLSVFLGRGNGDVFSSLHEQYAWRTKFKSLTLGAGIYRDIPILKALRIQPYIGVVRTRALLRPSDLYGNNESFEYRLTAFCIGVPLVCGF